MSTASKGRYISFVVFGKAIPQGRPRAFRAGNKIFMHTPKNTEQWRQDIRLEVSRVIKEKGWQITDHPVGLYVKFQFVRPKSYSKNKAESEYPYKRPDLDNLVKAVEDALTGIVWTDDARIVSMTVAKVWGSDNRVEISVKDLID